ncbi:hypothetical protein P175DRAFT_0527421 [Aspergillus ochraceoroseus IBT 24754]|uniref:DUF7721 domain-containing protein n=3 Tax=Aspergillus subgen. Nidulantes TaxID=2720870 RepID=A0A0F8WDT1_9EURO|nr:uncharacterized protein P175DRAFT_0527421 [Aspergillus ochraceoroseus IBT 24754]KKK12613.1 hypothetical protein AOCH_002319 [Aspergillus ochraceoroseus]KKK16040.1 hypothetical protein ARAM_004606 [Aspergillus rambellii]PTU23967.1 hypothetical protein P175DRAFT_0527421 [Aspergillus ochraceoroseus IBT 24754]
MSLQNMLLDVVKQHFDPNDNDDLNPALNHAAAHGTDSSLFAQALSFVKERKSSLATDEVDEQHLVQSHQSLYNGSGQQMDSRSVGAGAAMQALKMFNSGSASQTGGGDKNAFIGMAMAQAEKMWDLKAGNGEAAGDKQSAVTSAAEMAFKMYTKSQMSGSSGTGGPAGLMALASKFM